MARATHLKAALLESPALYRLWQAPFAGKKLHPLRAHNDLTRVRRVLDLGCGPGTNAPVFQSCDYVGVDINPHYIASARRRFRGEFIVADLRDLTLESSGHFDLVLLNSLLHHIDDAGARAILLKARELLAPDGHVHVLDLVLPERAGVARFLARSDRGEHPRPLSEWRHLLAESFEPRVCEPFALRAFGVTLWQMLYFKGAAAR